MSVTTKAEFQYDEFPAGYSYVGGCPIIAWAARGKRPIMVVNEAGDLEVGKWDLSTLVLRNLPLYW
jgi:hypothetical protein